jgi:hypothetical protein
MIDRLIKSTSTAVVYMSKGINKSIYLNNNDLSMTDLIHRSMMNESKG